MPRPRSGATTGPSRTETCECGEQVSAKALARHRGTAKHLMNLAQISGEAETDNVTALHGDMAGEGRSDEGPGGDPRRPDRPARPKVVVLPTRGASNATKQAALDEAAEISEFIQRDLIETIAPAAPVLATYWSGEVELNVRNHIILCRNHPQVLAGTLKAADWMAYYGLAKFGTGLLVGLGVETGFLAADNRLAQAAGITAAWEAVMAEREEIREEVYANYRHLDTDDEPEQGPWPGLGGEVFGSAADA